MLSHAINHQLTNWLGFRVVRVKAHEDLMAHSAGQMRRLANSPLAMERVAKLGRLLRPQQARGVKKVRLDASNDCGYVCLDDFDGLEAAPSLGIAAEVSWDAEMAVVGWSFTSMTTPSKDRPSHMLISAFIGGRSERAQRMTAKAWSPLWNEPI
jgi:hypothetical protein